MVDGGPNDGRQARNALSKYTALNQTHARTDSARKFDANMSRATEVQSDKARAIQALPAEIVRDESFKNQLKQPAQQRGGRGGGDMQMAPGGTYFRPPAPTQQALNRHVEQGRAGQAPQPQQDVNRNRGPDIER